MTCNFVYFLARSRGRHSRYGVFEAAIIISMANDHGARQCLPRRLSLMLELYLEAFLTCLRSAAAQLYRGPHSSLDPQTPDQAYFNRLLHIGAGEGWYPIVKTGNAALQTNRKPALNGDNAGAGVRQLLSRFAQARSNKMGRRVADPSIDKTW